MNGIGKNIIMIGGGLGGLVTGAFLAKEGFRVTVLEKNPIIGGGLQCFYRHGVIFETGMHILGGFMPGDNLHKIFTYLGILDKLHIRHTDSNCIDSVTFGVEGDTYLLPRGREAFENYLAQRFPAQAEGLHRYMDAMWALSEEVDLFYLRTDESNMLREHSREFLMPADEFIAQYITDPNLAELLAYMNPMYAGVAGHTPAFIHALINVLYINGSSMFVDGSQQMADALADIITSAGGSIHANDPVTDIVVEEHLVRQVQTRSGKTYAGDLYISDIGSTAKALKGQVCFKAGNALWLAALKVVQDGDAQLMEDMQKFAGLPEFDSLKILPAGEAGCAWAKAYSKLLTPEAGFAGKIKEVLAANADAYAEEVENTAAAMLKAL